MAKTLSLSLSLGRVDDTGHLQLTASESLQETEGNLHQPCFRKKVGGVSSTPLRNQEPLATPGLLWLCLDISLSIWSNKYWTVS